MTWPLWDTQLFLKINTEWTSQAADVFFSTVTDLHKNSAFILIFLSALLLLIYFLRNEGFKFLVGLVLCLGLSDAITYHFIKKSIQRPRPALSLSDIRILSPFGGKLSFPSNHAANTMAAAVFVSMYWGIKIAIPFFIWAIVISYSRIYVGVHYPLDVLVGMLSGAIIAFFTIRATRLTRFFSRNNKGE